MAYDTPVRISHYIHAAALSTAAGTTILSTRGPKGMKGRVWDISINITTSTPASTVLGIGTALGAAGTRGDIATFDISSKTAPITTIASVDDPTFKSKAAATLKGKIGADQAFHVSMVSPGTSAVGNITIVVEWYF